MKVHKKSLWMVILSFSLLVFSCVTINIYFPAEKVESVAGEIVDEIRNRKPAKKDSTSKKQQDSFFQAIKLAVLPSAACAQEVTEVSNPTIRALKQKMKERYAQMKPFYQKGMLKEGNDGYVSTGDTTGLGLKDKRDLNNLVNAENNDRKTLYAEVAKALKIDGSQINKVAEIFAKEWQK